MKTSKSIPGACTGAELKPLLAESGALRLAWTTSHGKVRVGLVKIEPGFLRIGVTGHRFLAGLASLQASVDRAALHVLEIGGRLNLDVVSSLAEGADRLVATRILSKPGSKLTAVLPMPKTMYMDDFPSSTSAQEFAALLARATAVVEMMPRSTREESYEAAGQYILEHCDVLMAVWDGRRAQGKGGTAECVAAARRRSIALIWIHAGNRAPGGTEATSLGPEQGQVSFERLDQLSRIASERNRQTE